MRRRLFLFLFLFLSACASTLDLQRVVHQAPDLLVILDKREIQASPSFHAPYSHPAVISPSHLQQILESVTVQPRAGFLKSLFSGENKKRPLFNQETVQLMALQFSQALAKADPSERIDFFHTLPKNSVTDAVTSGFLLVKDKQLHLRVQHYQVPLRKGSHPSSVGRGIPNSEKAKFAFILSEGDHMAHRSFKNVIGLSGSDSHWLVIDYAAFSSPSRESAPASLPLPKKNESEVEERLRTLKHLWKEGLISDEDYIEKKKTILKAF